MAGMEMFLDLIDYYDLGGGNPIVLKQKVAHLSVAQIRNICRSLTEAAKYGSHSSKPLGMFDFVVSHSLSANHGYSCAESKCRLDKVSNLGTFSVLYSNTIYLPNYFSPLLHFRNSQDLKYAFYSDLLIINSLRPAIQKGYIKILELGLCQNCLKSNFEEIDSQFTEEIIDTTEDYYIQTCEVEVLLDKQNRKIGRVRSSLLDHGSVIKTNNEFINNCEIGKLTKSQIKKSEIIKNELKRCLNDLRYHGIAKNLLNCSFMTNHSAQESLISKVNMERAKINETLKMLFLETPIFENVSLEKIIEIRELDGQSFQVIDSI